MVDGVDGVAGGLGGEVTVGVRGGGQGGVPQGLGDGGEGDAGGDGDGGCEVAKVVDGGAGNAELAAEAAEVIEDVGGVVGRPSGWWKTKPPWSARECAGVSFSAR